MKLIYEEQQQFLGNFFTFNNGILVVCRPDYVGIYRLIQNYFELSYKVVLPNMCSAAISTDGKTIVIGNIGNFACVFIRNGNSWTQQAKLLASDHGVRDNFGQTVSIASDGNTIIVGAPFKTLTAGQQGAAYIFTRTNNEWTQQAKLLASDPANGDNFAHSVSISSDGNTAIAGAYFKNGTVLYQGAAYVFTRVGNEWVQQAKLLANDPHVGDNFGISVSITSDGNTALVGASKKTDKHWLEGAVYVFARAGNVWTQQAKLTASDGEGDDRFGCSTDITEDGNMIVVGASHKTNNTDKCQGALYAFVKTDQHWSQQAKLLANNVPYNAYFGKSVKIGNDGDIIVTSYRSKCDIYNQRDYVQIFRRITD